jgi:hypothetical protein
MLIASLSVRGRSRDCMELLKTVCFMLVEMTENSQ